MRISKPIIFFDLETTGVQIEHDRIVQIATVKINPDGSREEKNRLINPGIPIPPEATAVHGITDEMVAKEPTFKQLAKGLSEHFDGCDLAGYNSDHFDIPMLIQEFHRCAIEFPVGEPVLLDAYKIEKMVNSHKLTETFKRYTGKQLDDAHDALADINGTVTVLNRQMEVIKERFPDVLDGDGHITPAALELFTQDGKTRFDYAGKCFLNDDGVVCWSIGKHRDKPVMDDRSYLNWVLNSNFPAETKNKLKALIIQENQKLNSESNKY